MSLLPAILLSLKLAASTTAILLVIALPLGWWLARTRARIRPVIEAVTALPLVLPPTVLGFYLLVLMSPTSAFGGWFVQITGQSLAFSFTGLLLASVLYSLPFAVQPVQGAFAQIGAGPIEAARSLGAGPFDAFRTVALPLARRGVLTAAVLSFAHTLGEFGVVLMVGGNIPGRTRVISIEVFTAVETLDFARAQLLSGGLLIFSLAVLSFVYMRGRGAGPRGTTGARLG